MSKGEEKGLMPELRFPDFRDDGGWGNPLIEDYFSVGSSKRVLQKDWTTQGVPFYRTRELVSLSKGEPFSSEIFISEELFSSLSSKYGVPSEGDFLVSGVGTLGISYLVQPDDRFYFKDGNVLWFAKKGDISSIYFKYCFESDWIQNQIIEQTSKSTVGTYTIQNAKKTSFLNPPTSQEQQKIADCLSSVDNLITDHTQKLDALKSHKKGLMQQLFPAEGETVPKLRFPGFRDKGGWRKLKLAKAAEFIDSLHETPKQYVESGYPMIRVSDVKDRGLDLNGCLRVTKDIYDHFTKRYQPQKGDIIFSRVGSCGESVLIDFDEEICLGQNTVLLKAVENSLFLFFYLRSDLIKMQVNNKVVGSSHKTLSLRDTKNFEISLPGKPEQQKIADCLSSIDNLITAQTQKIESLKAHKKGLMQKLFPSMDETNS